MPAKFDHVHLHAADPEKTRAFYTKYLDAVDIGEIVARGQPHRADTDRRGERLSVRSPLRPGRPAPGERAWRSLKNVLDIQPVFLRNDERIAAHVTPFCTITYLLERWAELKTGQSFREIRRRLSVLHATELIGDDQRLWKGNRLEDEQRALWKKLEVKPPPKVLATDPLPRLPAEQM